MSLATITSLSLEENKETELDEDVFLYIRETERVLEYLEKVKGLKIDRDQVGKIDPDIIAIFPGNTVIRYSNTLAEMNGHRLGRCQYASKCNEFRDGTVRCCLNNYDMLNNKNGILRCYSKK